VTLITRFGHTKPHGQKQPRKPKPPLLNQHISNRVHKNKLEQKNKQWQHILPHLSFPIKMAFPHRHVSGKILSTYPDAKRSWADIANEEETLFIAHGDNIGDHNTRIYDTAAHVIATLKSMPGTAQAIREYFKKKCALRTMKLNQFNSTGKDIGTWSVGSSNASKSLAETRCEKHGETSRMPRMPSMPRMSRAGERRRLRPEWRSLNNKLGKEY
jgi:hypothetical protein